MASLDSVKNDPEGHIFDQLSGVRAGLLGIEGSGQHMQPMAHHVDRDAGMIHFITSSKTDLVAAIANSPMAHFTVTGKKHDFWVSLKGPISVSKDQAKLDEIWSSISAAWFDEGREDPEVTLLSLSLHEAALWAATGNPVVFGLEIARANLDEEHKPEIGEHIVVNFKR